MYSFIKRAFVSIFALALAGTAFAESQLDSLIIIALKNNPEIKMARYESRAAQTQISVARQLPDPQLKISGMNVPSNFSLTSDMMTMLPQISVMQMFPWFGKLDAASNIRKYRYEASADRLSNISLEVIANIKKVYGEIYRIQKSIEYLEYKRDLLRSVVKVAEQLFAVGQVPQQDVFRATAELTMVQSDIITMNAMLSDQYAKLAALIGSSRIPSIRVDTLQMVSLPPLDSLEYAFRQDNPYLRQIQNLRSAAEAKTIFARKDAIPDINVGISYGYRGALMPDGTKAYDMLNFEVGLSLPIFFLTKQKKMIEEADFMKRATDEEYTTAELSLTSQLRSTYADAYAQSKLIPLYAKELIPQYEATYNSSLSAYSVGKTTFAMLIDNLTTLINTKIELVKIESLYFSATAEISKLVGEGSLRFRGEE